VFTGLIECIGSLVSQRRTGESIRLEVAAALPPEEVAVGDSIAVNGACLTVTTLANGIYGFDVSPETVARTTFHLLRPGSPVNIERALKLGGRLDGHLVTGHVDCMGRLESRISKGSALFLTFSLPPDHIRLLVEKGSVAIDGISLTVNTVEADRFTVAIIPHTLEKTTLASLSPGQPVNIETDIIGKYVARLIAPSQHGGGLTLEKLMQNGFI